MPLPFNDTVLNELGDFARLRAVISEVAQQGESRLPPEPQLSEMIGVTRGRLRTLLKRMEDDGSIWRHVGRGTFIGPREVRPDVGSPNAEISVEDIFATRLLLEPRLAAQAAIHSTPSDVAMLVSCLSDMEKSTNLLEWKRLDDKLHRLIACATNNQLLVMLYDTMRSQIKQSLNRRMEEVYASQDGPRSSTHGQHDGLVAAIRDHSPKRAEEAMVAHITSVRSDLFDLR